MIPLLNAFSKKIPLILFGILLASLGANAWLFFLFGQAKQTIATQQFQIALQKENQNKLSKAITEQNEAIKQLKIKASNPPKTIKEIQTIQIKDQSCQSQLKAYQAIFNILGK